MIESLHSPHIARVKALISSRGNKERAAHGEFIAEGLQCAREAFTANQGPSVKTIYLTESGKSRIDQAGLDLTIAEVVMVSEPVMAAMSSTMTPQGIIAICAVADNDFAKLKASGKSRYIYLHEIQDPGNAGTILRTADAMGVDAVITSPGSVDMYSPKVVRATAGSLWHLPLYESISFADLSAMLPTAKPLLLSSHAKASILDLPLTDSYISIFGNEARGVDASALGVSESSITAVTIPMAGRAESLNLSAAASIVIFTLSRGLAG
jgi:TrmH family RNA methyltransferase